MASYEVQAKSKEGWQIVGVFEAYDGAEDCARQLDHDRVYDELRITREVEDSASGRFRATVVYRCGQKIRDDITRDEEEQKKQVAFEKRQIRLNKEIAPRATRKSDKLRAHRDALGHPFWLALWSIALFAAGMGALYLFEFVLFDK